MLRGFTLKFRALLVSTATRPRSPFGPLSLPFPPRHKAKENLPEAFTYFSVSDVSFVPSISVLNIFLNI